MHVREHAPIAPDEDGVARHAHVELDDPAPAAVGVLDAEREQRRASSSRAADVLSRTQTMRPAPLAPAATTRCRRPRAARRAIASVVKRAGHRLGDAGGVHDDRRRARSVRRACRAAAARTCRPRLGRDAGATADRAPARRRTGASGDRDRRRSRRVRRLGIQPGSRSVERQLRGRRAIADALERLVDVAVVVDASALHHLLPSSTIAIVARRGDRAGDAAAPRRPAAPASRRGRAALRAPSRPTMATKPPHSSSMNARSSTPQLAALIASVVCGSVGTGTESRALAALAVRR